MSGSNNPAWTGKHICDCGAKKSHGAKQCRKCSFESGNRSGKLNGRYVKENREYWLECRKSRNSLSGLMNNVCKQMGIQKNRRKTVDMLGYTWQDFKERIESQFQPGMTWDNHGEWHIDHITPVDTFIKNDIYNVQVVNALKNLQPMWAKSNLLKSNSHTKTKIYLITGPSGSGKTTLVNEINNSLVIDGDKIKPDQLIYEALNKDFVFYFINIGVSTFIKRFQNLYDIELYTIDISQAELSSNLFQRGFEISERILARKKYIDSLQKTKHMKIDSIKNMILKTLGV
jgi:hypothetical protein